MADPPKQMIDGIEFLGGIFVELEEAIKDANYQPALEPHLRGLEKLHGGYFQGQKDPTGKPWAPLAESTIKRKGHDIILVETTKLASSLIRHGSDSVREVTPESLVFGTSTPYASLHQDGTKRMPARPPVGITEDYVDVVANDVADRLVEEMKAKP